MVLAFFESNAGNYDIALKYLRYVQKHLELQCAEFYHPELGTVAVCLQNINLLANSKIIVCIFFWLSPVAYLQGSYQSQCLSTC